MYHEQKGASLVEKGKEKFKSYFHAEEPQQIYETELRSLPDEDATTNNTYTPHGDDDNSDTETQQLIKKNNF